MKFFLFLSCLAISILGIWLSSSDSIIKVNRYFEAHFFQEHLLLRFSNFRDCGEFIARTSNDDIERYFETYINSPRKEFFLVVKECMIKTNKNPELVKKIDVILKGFK